MYSIRDHELIKNENLVDLLDFILKLSPELLTIKNMHGNTILHLYPSSYVFHKCIRHYGTSISLIKRFNSLIDLLLQYSIKSPIFNKHNCTPIQYLLAIMKSFEDNYNIDVSFLIKKINDGATTERDKKLFFYYSATSLDFNNYLRCLDNSEYHKFNSSDFIIYNNRRREVLSFINYNLKLVYSIFNSARTKMIYLNNSQKNNINKLFDKIKDIAYIMNIDIERESSDITSHNITDMIDNILIHGNTFINRFNLCLMRFDGIDFIPNINNYFNRKNYNLDNSTLTLLAFHLDESQKLKILKDFKDIDLGIKYPIYKVLNIKSPYINDILKFYSFKDLRKLLERGKFRFKHNVQI